MNIIKENAKFILGFILGGLILGSISVYAALTYNASQITYTKSNNTEVSLDNALDELYTDVNTTINNLTSEVAKYNTLTLAMRTYCNSNANSATSNYMLMNTNIKQMYSKFTINSHSCNNVSSYSVSARSTSSDIVHLSENITYNLSDYITFWTSSIANANASDAYCDVNVTFSN